jgi:hypothetical protein
MSSSRARLAVAVLVGGGYLAIAWSAENLYPFSRFEMYSGARSTTASRIIARDAAGAAHEVTSYDSYRCDREPTAARDACPGDYYTIPYKDRQALDHVAAHLGGGGDEGVEIIRRVWRLSGPGAPPFEDCVLARCDARRRR